MSFLTTFSLHNIRRQFLLSYQLALPRCNYAKKETGISTVPKKKKLGKIGPMIEKKVLPVETDATKLANFVCGSNIYKTGQDVELKPDSEYPEWLWNLRTGPPPPLEELDPNTKEYWRRVRCMAMRRNNKLAKLRRF